MNEISQIKKLMEAVTLIESYEYDNNALVQAAMQYQPKSNVGQEVKAELDMPDSLPYSVDDVIQLIDEVFYEGLENGSEGPASREEKMDLRWFRQAVKQATKKNEGYAPETNEPYQNYKPEEGNDTYDKKTGKWSRSGEYDHLDPEAAKEFWPSKKEAELDERQSIAKEPSQYDIAMADSGLTIYTRGGKPELEMSVENWIELVSKFNRQYRGKL